MLDADDTHTHTQTHNRRGLLFPDIFLSRHLSRSMPSTVSRPPSHSSCLSAFIFMLLRSPKLPLREQVMQFFDQRGSPFSRIRFGRISHWYSILWMPRRLKRPIYNFCVKFLRIRKIWIFSGSSIIFDKTQKRKLSFLFLALEFLCCEFHTFSRWLEQIDS